MVTATERREVVREAAPAPALVVRGQCVPRDVKVEGPVQGLKK